MLTRTRKAFTLLELIVVIVILGILALIAIPTFASVIDKSHQSSANETVGSVGRDAAALAAFDQKGWSDGTYLATAAGEVGSGVTVTPATGNSAGATTESFTVKYSNGGSYCVTLTGADTDGIAPTVNTSLTTSSACA